MDPCISDDGEYELCRLPLHCIVRCVVCSLRFVRRFSAHADNDRSVVFIQSIIFPNSCGFGECRALAREICSLWPNKADYIVDCARFVIRDLKKEGSNGLSKSCKVGVGWLYGDQLKLIEGVGKLCHDIFGRHSVLKMA